MRCRRCSATAVDVAASARPLIADVRALMHAYGVGLPNRVRVDLTSPDEMRQRADVPLHGLTLVRGGPAPEVIELRVVDGLPGTVFGAVLAHEMGHAWLAGCPPVHRSSAEEEGICELLASWWLEHRGGPLARHALWRMRENPDPVYGGGFRAASSRADGRAPAAVVRRVRRVGRL